MKKVALIVVGVMALAGSANAQGTWYTNSNDFIARLSGFSAFTDYNANRDAANSITLDDVTATATGSGTVQSFSSLDGYLQASADTTVTFTSANTSVPPNAFFGLFQTTSSGSIDFNIEGSLTSVYNLSTTNSTESFLGYISDSSSPISVKVSPNSGNSIRVKEFVLAQGTNPLAGGNVAPEPGSLALALTGGCALVGVVIRRRKTA